MFRVGYVWLICIWGEEHRRGGKAQNCISRDFKDSEFEEFNAFHLALYVCKQKCEKETTFTKLLSLLIISPNSFRSFRPISQRKFRPRKIKRWFDRHSTSGMQCNSNQRIKHFLRVPARGGEWRDPMMELGWVWGRKSLPDKSFCENAAMEAEFRTDWLRSMP